MICKHVLYLSSALLLLGCTSRYRLDLYLTRQDQAKKVKVEQTEFLVAVSLNDPYAREKTVAGSTNIVVITTGVRWQQTADKRVFMFGFDEYLRCRIYLQLPQRLVADTIYLRDNSFVHLLGQYDLPPESKIFLPVSGNFIVDSVTTKALFGTLHGQYENKSGSPLGFDGKFKVRIVY